MLIKPDSCIGCLLHSPPWGKPVGFVPADGTGRNGVLIVLEAAGQTEEEDGRPVVGKAGHFLFSQLARIGLERDDFRIHNVLSCFPGDTTVDAAGIKAIYRRWYSGDVITVTLGSGSTFSGTPNHPVMTQRGWIGLGKLIEGDYLIYGSLEERMRDIDPYVQHRPTKISELFGTFTKAGISQRMVCSNMDFHGDGFNSNIEIVSLDGLLPNSPNALSSEPVDNSLLEQAGEDFVSELLASGRSINSTANFIFCRNSSLSRYMGRLNQSLSTSFIEVSPPGEHRFTSTTKLDPSSHEPLSNGSPTSIQAVCNILYSFPRVVGLDNVVDIKMSPFYGHVYNLHTDSEQYIITNGRLSTGYIVHNCRPMDNKLAKMPYEAAAIEHCAPNLDATIKDMQERCKSLGKHFTILTLGRIAFKRVMGLGEKHPIMKEDYQCYPHWSEKYQAWVIAGDHPSYLLKGNNHLIPVLQFAARRAVEIAECGVPPDDGVYLCDPTPAQFTDWVKDYLEAVRRDPGGTLLSYDIETPHKKGKDEEKVAKEDDDDYTILRCAFSYQPGKAVSVPWTAVYVQGLETLFSTPALKLGWNVNYDSPRVRAQMPVAGVEVDGMVAWHVLNSALPKGLGFVTPFYCQRAAMWKHLSDSEPALYNAKDADFALRNWLGIADGLKEVNLWPVFDRHILKLNEALAYMSGKGVLRDEAMRREAEHKLSELLAATEIKMQGAVPQAARRLHPKNGYKREPKSTEGLVKTLFTVPIQSCSRCGAKAVSKRHVTPRKTKPNPCEGAGLVEVVEQVERWAKPLDFKISSVGLKLYQSALQHQAIIHRREKRVTFDDTALKQLIRKYPGDHLYPLIGAFREYQKLLTTYIGVTQDV